MVMSDPKGRGLPKGHASNWGNGFLPGSFQGTWINTKGDPIPNLKRVAGLSQPQQHAQLQLLDQINREHLDRVDADRELTARIKSFELAYRMQTAAPEAMDVEKESKATQQAYGLDQKETQLVGRQCIMARRLIERGVRFVQLYAGTNGGGGGVAD